ncbi:MAG: alpha/beta fold hydrolase [Pseudomonadota bacterium]
MRSLIGLKAALLSALSVAAYSASALSPLDASETKTSQSSVAAKTCAGRLAGAALEFDLIIKADGEREVPVTLFTPSEPGTYPLVAFSHGAFASPTRYRAMLQPLAAAGFIVVAPMHIDSEEFPRDASKPDRPPHPITWKTRNEDMALALDPPEDVLERLARYSLELDPERVIALGHSYGALIAQLTGGALAFEPDGSQIDRTNPHVDSVVGWSPPGPMAGFMAEAGWNTLGTPSLTITGTADILPGFVDDWQAHRAAHDNAPEGARALWVGDGIDHYFGGMFGREKPPSPSDRALFERALATSLNFIDRTSGASEPCELGPARDGETYEEDNS